MPSRSLELLAQGDAENLLPPTAKRKVFERIAIKIREFAGAPLEERLDPWGLAARLKLRVLTPDQIEGISLEVREVLLGGGGWSGGASPPLPDGSRLVFLNPTHSAERQAATLMEEICHVVLGHTPTRIHGVKISEGERARFRDFNEAQEEAAYGVGSAALVPYFPLRRAIEFGLQSDAVASHYGVSRQLVEYRLKVCRLWEVYRAQGGPVGAPRVSRKGATNAQRRKGGRSE
jgi:hypothetical protein